MTLLRFFNGEVFLKGRRKRENVALQHKCNADATYSNGVATKCNTEKDKETDIDTDTEKETETEVYTVPEGTVSRTKDVRRVMEAWNSLGLQQLTKITPGSSRGKMLLEDEE